jgi:heme/copper-type cytochrome/quinol oxidase subunit 2
MPQPNSRHSQVRRQAERRKTLRRRVRIGLFAAASAAVLGIAIVLLVNPLRAVRAPAPSANAPAGENRQIVITMAGFTPPGLRLPAGKPFTVRLVNPDSQFHTDGGGWHQFRVEALGVDVRIPPRSEQTQAFTGLAAGSYEFYCDICCGGKENPSMRGVIEVTG